jgi:WXG100 family type VII secretion target
VTELTLSEFRVDLDDLESAIGTVQAQADSINTNCQAITGVMQDVPGSWNTPAGQTFSVLTQACITQMDALTGLLTEMIQRMQAAYQTYLNVEQTNTNNLQ